MERGGETRRRGAVTFEMNRDGSLRRGASLEHPPLEDSSARWGRKNARMIVGFLCVVGQLQLNLGMGNDANTGQRSRLIKPSCCVQRNVTFRWCAFDFYRH